MQPDRPALLSQLVHDLNQPLSAIANYAQAASQLIDKGMTDPARLQQLFEKIASQCDRATALSQEIGNVAKTPPTGKDLI